MQTPDSNKKIFYMKQALLQARKSLRLEEVPVGAVVVDEHGVIIGRGYNKIEREQSHVFHAEMIAIRRACKKKENWRLNGCSIYVTLEPCLMCLGLIRLSRVSAVFFAVKSPEFGGMDCVTKKSGSLFAGDMLVEQGIEKESALQLLKSFFQYIRKKRKVGCERKT